MEIYSHEKYEFFKEIINIDIDEIMDKWYHLNKDKEFYELYKHFILIGMSKKDLLELEDEDEMVKKIKNEVFRLNSDSNFYQFLTDEEDKEILRNDYLKQGIKQGIEQGIEQTNINNARSMKLKNIPINIINEITGLDTKLIASL